MTGDEFVNQLKNDVYCRLRPAHHGVGVFAVKDIPPFTNPFRGCDDTDYKKIHESELSEIEPEVMSLVKDFLVYEDGYYWYSDRGIQGIDISYFLNHSKKPNMTADMLGENFYTTRLVKAGEEIVVDYDTYDSQDDDFRK